MSETLIDNKIEDLEKEHSTHIIYQNNCSECYKEQELDIKYFYCKFCGVVNQENCRCNEDKN
jgi:hypothetical protein